MPSGWRHVKTPPLLLSLLWIGLIQDLLIKWYGEVKLLMDLGAFNLPSGVDGALLLPKLPIRLEI